jgi:hypothetical protein
MVDKTVKITCAENLSILNVRPRKSVSKEYTIIGSDMKCAFRSLLYFDIGCLQMPEDAIIHYAALRIYINKIEANCPISKLFAVPLLKKFNQNTTPNSLPQFTDMYSEIDICKNLKGWLDIDISEIFSSWINGNLENNGLALLSEEDAASISNLLIDPACNNALKPALVFGYSFDCRPHQQKQIEVKEFCKVFRFIKETVTPLVNVERIKLGTFFVTNVGDTTLTVILETSANRCDWVKDCAKTICTGGTEAIVGKYYGKYYRLKLISEGPGEANVQFIAQFIN